MSSAVELKEKPQSQTMYMLTGWRQWADAGSMSSGLPQYLIQENKARKIGTIKPDGFYLFQIPGTHDLVRPMVRFENGFPKALETPHNEVYYTGDDERGYVIILGDEPHLNIEQYIDAVLYIVEELKVKRIISFGGVYGELPYDKERTVSGTYSLKSMQEEMENLALNLSDYQGGASIGSFLCKRAGERNIEYAGFYAFVPTYDFSSASQIGNAIRIENDFMAWYGVMRRVNHMIGARFDLTDLEKKCKRLIDTVDAKVEELDSIAPKVGVREYMQRLSDEFDEVTFDPLGNVWEDEIKRLFDDGETDNS